MKWCCFIPPHFHTSRHDVKQLLLLHTFTYTTEGSEAASSNRFFIPDAVFPFNTLAGKQRIHTLHPPHLQYGPAFAGKQQRISDPPLLRLPSGCNSPATSETAEEPCITPGLTLQTLSSIPSRMPGRWEEGGGSRAAVVVRAVGSERRVGKGQQGSSSGEGGGRREGGNGSHTVTAAVR